MEECVVGVRQSRSLSICFLLRLLRAVHNLGGCGYISLLINLFLLTGFRNKMIHFKVNN